MSQTEQLMSLCVALFPELTDCFSTSFNEVTVSLPAASAHSFLKQLRDEPRLKFDMLIDLCGVDYLTYGRSDWETEAASTQGFCRAARTGGGSAPDKRLENEGAQSLFTTSRFAVVYHLLSTNYGTRLRVKAFLEDHHLLLPSVQDIWQAANWFEREAYDLYGILFENHPDLRRLLTDYGFIGHPFRKDFPLSGQVEVRYDATLGRVIYEPVSSVVPRVTVPKVIRHDNRYVAPAGSAK